MNKNKGFTLIELLVVIAIIGILSSVVLASLNSARNKGADAAIKNNLSNIRAQAELVYDSATPNSYEGVCENGTIVAMVNSAASASGGTASFLDATVATSAIPVCHDDTGTWAVQSGLKAGGYWCVDSTGASKGVTTALGASTYACPAS